MEIFEATGKTSVLGRGGVQQHISNMQKKLKKSIGKFAFAQNLKYPFFCGKPSSTLPQSNTWYTSITVVLV